MSGIDPCREGWRELEIWNLTRSAQRRRGQGGMPLSVPGTKIVELLLGGNLP